jgi:hypothetical protein
MFRFLWRVLTAPFRLIPWYVWLAVLAAGAWFGRNMLVIIASIIAFHPIPVPPLFQAEPESVREAQLQDLEHFDHVRRNERSMSDETRAEFDQAVMALEAQAGSLSPAAFQLGLARAQALIDNGHSNASATRMVQAFPRIPIRSAYVGSEVRVLRARAGQTALLGARLTHINGQPVDLVAARFRDAFGGLDTSFNSIVPLVLETPAYLEAVGLGINDLHYQFEMPDGQAMNRRFELVAPIEGAVRVFSGDLLQSWTVEDEGWVAFEPASTPLYLRRPDHDYWLAPIPDLDAVYINLRANLDDESGESLVDFVARAQVEVAELNPTIVIVDQRFNGGGDLTRTEPLMTALADLVPDHGRIYLIAGGNTFSAGIVNLAMAKEAAPDRTILVGEPIGDRLQFWAEGFWYSLPNSNFRARYSTGYYDLQNGCSGVFRCHWGSLHIFPVIIDDLDIDLAAPTRFADYAAGHDAAMAAIRAAEASSSRP